MDGRLTDELDCVMYEYSEIYEANTLACSEDGEYFNGQSSALYFIQAVPSELHKVINSLYKTVPLSDLPSILSGNLLQWRHKIPSINLSTLFPLDRILFSINPKLVLESTGSHENEEIFIDKTKKVFTIGNGVRCVRTSTLVHHNTTGQTTFANIGGVKVLLPILEQTFSSQSNLDSSLLYLFSL